MIVFIYLRQAPNLDQEGKMIVGVGVDILHFPRLQSLVSRRGREALAKRILHPSEFAQFVVAEDKNRFLAVR